MFDRDRERKVLDWLLDSGHGGVLVMHGEAGVGKTALLEYAVDAGREFRVARTAGVETEMELPSRRLSSFVPLSLTYWTASRSPSKRRSTSPLA